MNQNAPIEKSHESLGDLKARADTIENYGSLSTRFLFFAIPALVIAGVLFILNLFTLLNCFLISIALIALLISTISVLMWYQCRRAEEFEASIRKKKLRNLNGPGKCGHLQGNLPDGKGRIGECTHYSFTLDNIPYCLYCREYTPPND